MQALFFRSRECNQRKLKGLSKSVFRKASVRLPPWIHHQCPPMSLEETQTLSGSFGQSFLPLAILCRVVAALLSPQAHLSKLLETHYCGPCHIECHKFFLPLPPLCDLLLYTPSQQKLLQDRKLSGNCLNSGKVLHCMKHSRRE